MKIQSPEQFILAMNEWLAIERELDSFPDNEAGRELRWLAEGKQLEIERALSESPFTYDADNNVLDQSGQVVFAVGKL